MHTLHQKKTGARDFSRYGMPYRVFCIIPHLIAFLSLAVPLLMAYGRKHGTTSRSILMLVLTEASVLIALLLWQKVAHTANFLSKSTLERMMRSTAFIQLCGCLVMMALLNFKIFLIISVLLLILGALHQTMAQQCLRASERVRKIMQETNGYLEKAYASHQTIRISCACAGSCSLYRQLSQKAANAFRRLHFFAVLQRVTALLLKHMGYLFAAIAALILLIYGRAEIEQLTILLIYVFLAFTAINMLLFHNAEGVLPSD